MKSDFTHFFFHDFIDLIATGQGQTAPRGHSFVVNRNVLSLHSFVASLKKKKMYLKSDCIHFFHDLIHVYSPGAGADSKFKKNVFEVPRGQQNLDVNRKALSDYPFVASFKEISLKSDFIQFFHDVIHVYTPGAGGIQPQGTKF